MAKKPPMKNELNIVRDVSARLEQGEFAYMLTGSMAMNYYAQPRMTRHIDIVIALAPQDTEIIVRLFMPDYYVSRDAVGHSILFSISYIKRASSKWTASSARIFRIAASNLSAASELTLKIFPPGLPAGKI
jgi:mRNA degradation ribonuclease J1/J2